MQNLPTYKKWILLFVFLVALFGFAMPVLADYLGPNRTVTQTVGTCKIVLYKCEFVAKKNDYRYHQKNSWSCSLEGKPWQAYPGDSKPCGENQNEGYQYWEREDGTEEIITTHPPATITGSIVDCTLQNGWCRAGTIPQLMLSANEPLAGHRITLIEGTLNGARFSCEDGVANCNVILSEGDNNFTYWALSSWGDSSTMGTSFARVDTVPPDVGVDILGTSGTNNWYISPTSVTAVGSDVTSGLASVLLSTDSLTWQPSITLNEGIHTVAVYAVDNAGNDVHTSAIFAVDTTTPAIAVSVNGTLGKNGWYRSGIQVSATPTDFPSGIATFEAAVDGAAYQQYTAPITFQDGQHTIRFKAVDHAGNQTETALQSFRVDSLAPTVDLPVSWQLGRNVPYSVLDEGSGLAALRIVIEDEDERYAKVAWSEVVSGTTYSQDIDWNGQFKDKTLAPPGTYLVWIKASDVAGNERFQIGKVIVPEPNLLLSLLPTKEPAVTAPSLVPPVELSDPEIDSATDLPTVLGFGGETNELPEDAVDATTQSIVLSSGEARGSTASTSPGVLWGAAAAAAIAAATTYAVETTRKRKDAEAEQAAQVKANIAKDKAERAEKKQKQQENWTEQQAEQALVRTASTSQIGKLGNSVSAPPSGISPEAQQAFLHGGGINAQNWIRKNLRQLQQAYLKQQADAKEAIRKREEAKRRAEEEAKKIAELHKLTNYYNAEKQRSKVVISKNPTQQKTVDKVWRWLDEHQREVAWGIGAAFGVVAILLSGGLAAPAVALYLTLGAAALAAGTTAVGTVILNNHFDREWHENLFNNVTDAIYTATIVAGGWFVLQKAMLVAGALCTNHPAACANAQPFLNAWDKAEEILLDAKIVYYTWKGDEEKVTELADELYSEYIDGGMPGNTVAKELADRVEDIGKVVEKYGTDAARLIGKHGLPALNLLRIVNPNDAGKLLNTLNDDVLYNVMQEGPDAVIALSHWNIDDLTKHGLELASRAKKDAKVLAAVQKLVASGPINPKNLTREQQALISEIAANSTQYADEGQVVLGKWVDYSSGFVEYAKDTISVHYNPHPDMWNLLGKLGPENQGDVAWLINRQVVQTGIDKGLPFEYTLNGISPNILNNEHAAIQAIFSGKADEEIMRALQSTYLPIRMKELQELQKAGYEFTFDEVANSYILILP